MQPMSGFAYDDEAFVAALDAFVDAVGLAGEQYVVLTHGFVLGQFGVLWAMRRAAEVDRLVILGVPLGRKTPLRPELAAYKAAVPFMRPQEGAKFAGDTFNAGGLAYMMDYADAQARSAPGDD
jgi:pimeloyl-ACP methyl ester carboxylesterase